MLGSQWSKEELTRFYKAYRKYGKNWRKVAGAIRSKSSEMVENLYNINKAFLSLPENQGTADAFLAMMTDRLNILDTCDSSQENSDALKITCKPKTRSCGKSRLGIAKESDSPCHTDLQNHSSPSCRSQTPLSQKKHYGDVLGGIMHHPVGKRTTRVPVQHYHDTNAKYAVLSPNMEHQRVEVNSAVGAHVGRRGLAGTSQNGDSLQASGVPSLKTYNRRSCPVRPFQKMHVDSDLANANYIDGGIDANCSGGSSENKDAGFKGSARDARQLHSEDSDIKESECIGKFHEKLASSDSDFDENKDVWELCSPNVEGELRSLNSLHELADLALGLSTSSAAELGVWRAGAIREQSACRRRLGFRAFRKSSDHAMEQRRNPDTDDKSNGPRSPSMNHESDHSQRIDTHGKATSTEKSIFYREMQQNFPLTFQIPRRKRRFLQAEVSGEDGKTSWARQLLPPPKRARLDQNLECTSLNKNLGSNNKGEKRPTSPVSSCLPAKTCSRRKMGLQKAFLQKELKLKTSTIVGDKRLSKDFPPVHCKADTIKLQRQLSNCLSSQKVRRWCMFEWFYSAIDYPWFAKYEFVNYLKHVRLGHVARLSRVEWSTIRSSLGKPRRFSKIFLLEEQKKLEKYRESVRNCYSELRWGVREGLPSDLARPLLVGQHVIVRDLKTGNIHDACILTVDHDRFEVRFANSDLGAQFVKDVDCMPLNPWKNMPVDLRNQNLIVDQLFDDNTGRNHLDASSEDTLTTLIDHVKIEATEADIGALAEISTALDKKEALLTELRHMNSLFTRSSGNMIDDVEQFKNQYAVVLSQLSDVKPQVESGRYYLRERNNYHENTRAQCFSSSEFSAPDAPSDCLSTSDLGQAVKIVERSKHEARAMVASTYLIGGTEGAFANTGDALDSTGYHHSAANSWTSHSSSIHPKISSTFQQQRDHTPSKEVDISSETKDLICDCLATCLIIQKCADGQHPPGVIEETLRRALASLQPSCPDNRPIYEEIEECLTGIKYDMIGRVPVKTAQISV